MRRLLSVCILTTLIQLISHAQNIIPLPHAIKMKSGSFQLNSTTSFNIDPMFEVEAEVLFLHLRKATRFKLPVVTQSGAANVIVIKKAIQDIPAEGYHLDIAPGKITITAADKAGAFYACMSLLQLLPANITGNNGKYETTWDIPAMSIQDAPRFKWRGLMLDCSRTFISPEYIVKTIDRLAFYKMNILHLHLTDDQGWRLEIQGRPLLTTKASMFDRQYEEPKEFEGFYSIRDIKEILKYAAARHVTIVPEIESPGHSIAALNSYPALSCLGDVPPIYPYFSGPGITKDVFCVGNQQSAVFFKEVLTEVAAIFPSPYLHLGGDEVPRTNWEKCTKCQQFVKKHQLENTAALQGYFMREIAADVIKKGKRPVAWDEILETEKFISKDWIIMSWRGSKPGLEAARKGFDVVMTPTYPLYFDYDYKENNSKNIFLFDPYSGEKNEAVRKHVLGIQANFWSHIDRTPSKIDYQLYPRLLALAERAWSSEENTNFENFELRQMYHQQWLKVLQAKYNLWNR